MGRDKSQKQISTGASSFHFHGFFPEDRIKGDTSRKTWKQYKLANGTHIFHSEIPFGNFGLPFKKSRFGNIHTKFMFRETRQNALRHLHCIRNSRRLAKCRISGCVSLRKSKIGFFNPKESENGFCVSLLNRLI